MRNVWMAVFLMILAATAPLGAQNLMPNGDFDTDVSGWTALPVGSNAQGTIDLSHDPLNDATGNPASGAMLVEWDLTNPSSGGNSLLATLLVSDCVDGFDIAAVYDWAFAERSDLPPATDMQLIIAMYTDPGCVNPINARIIPLGLPPSYDFRMDQVPNPARSVSWSLEVFLEPDGSGASSSQGSLLLDQFTLTEQVPNLEEIPTLSTVGLLLVIVLLGACATMVLRRQRLPQR